MNENDTTKNLINVLLVFIISLLFFWIVDVPYRVFSLIIICSSIIIRTKYRKNNYDILTLTALINLSSMLGFFIEKIMTNETIKFDKFDNVLGLFVGVITISFLITGIRHKKPINTKQKILTEPQKYDMYRIQEYIENFDLIGINGAWGTGKTFLSEYIQSQKDINDKYLFINIDLLSSNLDNIQLVVFNSLEKTLNNHYIYSKNSKQIKKLLSEISVINRLLSFMQPDETSYSNALRNFQSELDYLNKTIVIVFEDIDRITSVDKIKEIFSISERLVCNNIKIVYHYNENKLEEMGLNHEYVEKYIPYVVNLTPIKFMNILKHLLNEDFQDTNIITIEDFKFLSIPKYIIWDKISFHLSLSLNGASFRMVKHFLYEVITTIKTNTEYNNDSNKKTVIIFYLIKHLYVEVYKKICVGESLIRTLKLSFKEKEYTVIELLNYLKINNMFNQETIEKLFESNTNGLHMLILSLLGYNFDVYSMASEKNLDEIYGEKTRYTKTLNTNDKIDRLIWNLCCNGKSEYTDRENAVKKFIHDVLDKDCTEQKEAYESFSKDMFDQNLYKDDHRTIFKIALNNWFSIFQAFFVSNVDKETWIKLIDFYFDFCAVKEIDHNLVATLRYCNISSNTVYIHILEKFNKLSIVGNMNDKNYYRSFLISYLRNLSSLSYIDTYDLEFIENCSETGVDVKAANMTLNRLNEKLTLLRERITIVKVSKDIDIVIEFISKNRDIINSELPLKQKQIRTDSKFSSRFIYQTEYDRLLKFKQTNSFKQEIENSYKNDKIGVHEIAKLLEDNK